MDRRNKAGQRKLEGEVLMKRLSFDTESDYYKASLSVGDVEFHRVCMRDWVAKHGPIRFDCAVVYDEEMQEYREFRNDQAMNLSLCLQRPMN